MSTRGKPLAWSLREQIKQRISEGESRRQIARELQLARDTVKKYAGRV